MIQIDIKNIVAGLAHCNLYTGERCVKILIPEYEYENLVKDGFFIRDGKTKDSANVINTTEVYKLGEIK